MKNIYHFYGISDKNEKIEDIIITSSSFSLKQKLRENKIKLKSYKLINIKLIKSKKFSLEKIMILTKELHILVKNSINIVNALDIIIQEEKDIYFKCSLSYIRTEILEGKEINKAFSIFPNILSDNYTSIIQIGELSNSLNKSLEDIYEMQTYKLNIRKKIKNALSYPLILLFFSLSIVFFLVLFVLPKFIDIFKENNVELPYLTKIIINISNNFILIASFILLVMLFLIFIFNYFKNKNRLLFDKFVFKIPLLNIFIKKIYVIRLSSSLSILIKSKVNISNILAILEDNFTNLFLKQEFKRVSDLVYSGKKLSTALNELAIFPRKFIVLIYIGEESGNLDEILVAVHKLSLEDFDDSIKKIVSFLEPSIILFLGIIISTVILAIYLPILNLNNLIQ